MQAIKLDKPQALAEVLHLLELQAEQSLIVVDDLHRVTSNEAFKDAIESHLEQGRAIAPILACGPTPEMNAFRGKFRHLFEITNFPMPCPSVEDLRRFAAWLGGVFDEKTQVSELLVEFLFELSVGQPLETFAVNFRERLKRVGVFEPVEAALAMNALDLPADMSLVLDDAGRDYINRLAADDQKHFDRTARLPDDRTAIRFSHNRIAWRLWDIWTTDHLSSTATSLRLARSLLPSVRLCNDVIKEVRPIAAQIVTRLPQLMGDTAATAALETLIELTRRSNGQPNTEAVLIQSALSQQMERNIAPGPEWLLKRCELLSCNPGVSPLLRASLAARFLLAAEAYDESHQQAVERSIKRILLDASNIEGAARALIWIANRAAAPKRRWSDWVTEWVIKYPASPHIGMALVYLVAAPAGREEIVEPALVWLRDTPLTPAHAIVWKKLLTARAGREEIVEAALAWLRGTPSSPAHATVWKQLLAATAGREEIVEAALAWLRGTPSTPAHANVWLQILATQVGREEIVESALAWLRGTPSSPAHANVWLQILATQVGREEIVESALAWLRGTPSTPSHAEVWKQLLAATAGREEIVESALAWLRSTPSTPSHAEVWKQLLAATACREEIAEAALAWLRGTPSTPAHAEVWKQLLAATAGREEIVEAALAWLRGTPSTPAHATVWAQLLAATACREGIAEAALAWLRGTPSTPAHAVSGSSSSQRRGP